MAEQLITNKLLLIASLGAGGYFGFKYLAKKKAMQLELERQEAAKKAARAKRKKKKKKRKGIKGFFKKVEKTAKRVLPVAASIGGNLVAPGTGGAFGGAASGILGGNEGAMDFERIDDVLYKNVGFEGIRRK